MYIKWLLIFNNPGGEVRKFEVINDLIKKVVGFCEGHSMLKKDVTIEVLIIVFNNLRLLNHD